MEPNDGIGETRLNRGRQIFRSLIDGGFAVGFAVMGVVIALPAELVIRGAEEDLNGLALWEQLVTFGLMYVVYAMIVTTYVFLSLIPPTLGLLLGGIALLRESGRNRLNFIGLGGCLLLLVILVVRHRLWRALVS